MLWLLFLLKRVKLPTGRGTPDTSCVLWGVPEFGTEGEGDNFWSGLISRALHKALVFGLKSAVVVSTFDYRLALMLPASLEPNPDPSRRRNVAPLHILEMWAGEEPWVLDVGRRQVVAGRLGATLAFRLLTTPPFCFFGLLIGLCPRLLFLLIPCSVGLILRDASAQPDQTLSRRIAILKATAVVTFTEIGQDAA